MIGAVVAGFAAGVLTGAGIGGNLVNRQWVEAGEFEKITAAAQILVAAVKEC